MKDAENLIGQELEDYGRGIFSKMGLVCINERKQAKLKKLIPKGSFPHGQNLEIDYLIPYENICLIGEIKGGENIKKIKNGYKNFQRNYNLLAGIVNNFNDDSWRELGVPDNYLRYFRSIREFRGFFVVANLEQFDVELERVTNIAFYHKRDWNLLVDYVKNIGSFAKPHFLYQFDLPSTGHRKELTIDMKSHGLVKIDDKFITSGDIGIADIFTFEQSPYELLPISQVYRKDDLPSLSSEMSQEYQRPLIPGKLRSIRKSLLENKDFIFPNSILAVLSEDCEYNEKKETLRIPCKYGALSIIDGQHRLFSYAHDDLEEKLKSSSKIMLTAIKFQKSGQADIRRYSAKTFIEINRNQTRLHSTHIDAIAYEVLGETHPKALAAKVILEANIRQGSKLFGLFDTNQTGLGVIQATTIITALKSLVNLEYIKNLRGAERGSRVTARQGYENLFGLERIDELTDVENLIQKSIVCFEQYFSRVAQTFSHDWPRRGEKNESSLQFAKVIAGFVSLLWQLIKEGADWDSVTAELNTIRANIMKLRKIQDYNTFLFDPDDPNIPDSGPSSAADYRFLGRNRQEPTPIQTVLAEKNKG